MYTSLSDWTYTRRLNWSDFLSAQRSREKDKLYFTRILPTIGCINEVTGQFMEPSYSTG